MNSWMSTPLIAPLLMGCLLSLAHCQSNSSPSESDGTPSETPAPLPDSWGTLEVLDCSGLSESDQPCYFTYQWDSEACSSPPCSKLSIYFSGGQMSCPEPDAIFEQLHAPSKRGYIAVCARVFKDWIGSAGVPRHQEGPRYDTLVKAIINSTEIQSLWDGRELLLMGVSHGGSGPVVAMARNSYDETTAWQGTHKTAACFFDGTYSPTEAMGFLHDNECSGPVSYERFYRRYCTWPDGATSADPTTWPAPETCTNTGTEIDTVTTIDVANSFSIRHWQLVECGSATDACPSDILPKEGIQALCSNINGTNDYSCDFIEKPQMSHMVCGGTALTIEPCLDWFENL